MAGPTIIPVCQAMEERAMALGSTSFGTRLGARAERAGPLKARATPSSTATENSTGSVIASYQVQAARVAVQRTCRPTVARATSRRFIWAATHPTAGIGKNNGRQNGTTAG